MENVGELESIKQKIHSVEQDRDKCSQNMKRYYQNAAGNAGVITLDIAVLFYIIDKTEPSFVGQTLLYILIMGLGWFGAKCGRNIMDGKKQRKVKNKFDNKLTDLNIKYNETIQMINRYKATTKEQEI